jgi:hypothetical protein
VLLEILLGESAFSVQALSSHNLALQIILLCNLQFTVLFDPHIFSWNFSVCVSNKLLNSICVVSAAKDYFFFSLSEFSEFPFSLFCSIAFYAGFYE